ncbi:MAG: protein kinase, partial [Nannocystaceae bacterium]
MELPRTIGRYTLTRKIGEGGMAEVYLGHASVAEGLHKPVVIKMIRREFAQRPEFTRMFIEEAKIALGLNHANIVQVFDFGERDGDLFLVLEWVEGIDLMRLVDAIHARGARTPIVIAAYLAHQVAAALAYAHQKRDDHGVRLGIIHRDVSPHNVMVSFAGTVKLLDFGIARQTVARTSAARPHVIDDAIQGKLAYMSPEQASGGSLDPRTDIYALGVMLYELLSGTLVRREGDTESILEAVRGEELPPLASVAPEVPEALCTVVDRALAFDREGRWESARAMQAALADFLHRNDPVVDDEVLAAYVADHSGAALADAGEETSLVDATTRELDDDAATVGLRLERRSLVILRAILVRGPLAIRGVSDRLLGLCRDIIFKRGGQTCRMDQEGITVAFGLVDAHDVVDQALRVALALREAIGDAAPGVGIGVVLARLSLGVGAGAPPRVEIAEALDRQLERMARRVVDGPVILAGGLAAAAGAWRLEASMHFPEARRPELTDWADDLEVARPLAGPVHESELRVTHPPGSRARLYGRELELKTLRDSFAEAIRVRETRSALIVGQPGLGKRTIVERFVDGLPPGAFYVLRGRGQWRHRNASLGLILELLRRFLGVGPTTTAASLEELLRGYGVERSGALAQALASTLVDDGEAVDGAGERTDAAPLLRREQLWELLRGLVGALARRRPVLVILEDLHFVDEHSFALLRAWLEEPPRLPILGVATARPGLRAMQLGQVASIARVELRELDARSRREMIVRRFEEPAAADELATAILERTGGNPLFIEETLAYLQRRQVIGWSEGGRFLAVLRA